jgi:hypothetical protein
MKPVELTVNSEDLEAMNRLARTILNHEEAFGEVWTPAVELARLVENTLPEPAR